MGEIKDLGAGAGCFQTLGRRGKVFQRTGCIDFCMIWAQDRKISKAQGDIRKGGISKNWAQGRGTNTNKCRNISEREAF